MSDEPDNGFAKRVMVDGVEYESVTKACRALRIAPTTLYLRMRHGSAEFL